MTTYKAIIVTSTMGESSAPGIMQCIIPSTQYDISPTDLGLEDAIVPVIYTSPYASHGDGGFIGIPPDGTNILVEHIGKSFYYLTSIVGPDPDDVNEVTEDTSSKIIGRFGCETSQDPIYNISDNFPDAVMLRHPKGHSLIMRDDAPMDNEEIQPIRKVHNSKIELKSAGGKITSLDDSNAVNALRLGIDKQGRDSNQFDGIIIGDSVAGITGPRCIKTQAENNITTTSEKGDIIQRVVAGNKYEVENTSIATEGMMPLLGIPVKPQVNMGTEFGDINLVAGNNEGPLADPIKSKLGPSKVIIEALGISRTASWVEDLAPPGSPVPNPQQMSAPVMPPIVRITSDGDIEIISNDPNPLTGKITIRSIGDINIESTAGNVNIKGLTVNLNNPAHIPIPFLPTSSYIPGPGISLRGYVPFGWMMPYTSPI